MTKNTNLPQPTTKVINWGGTYPKITSSYPWILFLLDSQRQIRRTSTIYINIWVKINCGKILLGTEILKETRRQKIETRKGFVCYGSCSNLGISQFTLKSRQHSYRANTRDPYFHWVSLNILYKVVRSAQRAIIEDTPTYSNSKHG